MFIYSYTYIDISIDISIFICMLSIGKIRHLGTNVPNCSNIYVPICSNL